MLSTPTFSVVSRISAEYGSSFIRAGWAEELIVRMSGMNGRDASNFHCKGLELKAQWTDSKPSTAVRAQCTQFGQSTCDRPILRARKALRRPFQGLSQAPKAVTELACILARAESGVRAVHWRRGFAPDIGPKAQGRTQELGWFLRWLKPSRTSKSKRGGS